MKKIIRIGSLFLLLLLLLFPGLKLTAANDYENLNIELPAGYPENLLPLIDGHAIRYSGFADKGDYQELNVYFYAEATPAEAAAYYEEIISRGTLEEKMNLGEEQFNLVGELEGTKIMLLIISEDEFDNYQSHITAIIKGNFADEIEVINENNKADLSSANKNVKDLNLLPEEYPLDLLPIYGGSLLTYGDIMDNGETEIIGVQFFSKDSKEKIRDFYAEVLKNAESKEYYSFEMGDLTYNLIGVLGEYKASFTISNPMYDYNGYTTLINLSVEDLN
jgi:hypothetical protein